MRTAAVSGDDSSSLGAAAVVAGARELRNVSYELLNDDEAETFNCDVDAAACDDAAAAAGICAVDAEGEAFKKNIILKLLHHLLKIQS